MEPRVIIFSSPQCKYCEQAKALLNEQGIAYEERNIGSNYKHRQDLLARLPQVRTLPQLFVDETCIGGAEDLKILIQNGDLETRLRE